MYKDRQLLDKKKEWLVLVLVLVRCGERRRARSEDLRRAHQHSTAQYTMIVTAWVYIRACPLTQHTVERRRLAAIAD